MEKLFFIPIFLAIIISGVYMVQATDIDVCQNLPTETYTLTKDVQSNKTCFNITGNNVVLDCNNYIINYSNGQLGYAINNSGGFDNITIKNCVIKQTMANATNIHSYGIFGTDMAGSTIENNSITASGNGGSGIYLNSSSNEDLSDNNTIFNNLIVISGGEETFITTIRPNEDITPKQWIPNLGLIHYNRVNEVIADNDTTYVYTPTTNYKDTFGMQNLFDGANPPSNSNIKIIQVTWYRRAKKLNLDLYRLSVSCLPSNWVHDQLFTTAFLTTSYATESYSLSQLGTLGNTRDITIDDINMVNLQLRSYISGGTNSIRCTQIYMNVTWKAESYGIYSQGANFNTLSNNTITTNSSYSYGIFLYSDSSSNNLTNNNIITSGTTGYGIYLNSSSNSNILTNNTITTSGDNGFGIYFDNSTDNRVKDSVINASYSYVPDIYIKNSGINNLTNCTFNKSDVSFGSGATGEINVHWYLDAYVNYSNGTAANEANVSSWDVNNALAFTTLTNSSGYIARQTLLEYMKNRTSTYYKTNYSINATKDDLFSETEQVNLTTNKEIYLEIGWICWLKTGDTLFIPTGCVFNQQGVYLI